MGIFIGWRFGHLGANPNKASGETGEPVKKVPAAKNKTRTKGAKIGILGGRRARSIAEYTSIILMSDLPFGAIRMVR